MLKSARHRNSGCGRSALDPVLTASPPPSKDIVDTAVAAGSFKTLATALDAADLVDTLKGPGPFTVFAPDRRGVRQAAGRHPRDRCSSRRTRTSCRRILTYHVVAGKVMAADVVKMQSAKAVSGDTITIAATAAASRLTRRSRQDRHRRQQRRHSRDRRGDPAEGQ